MSDAAHLVGGLEVAIEVRALDLSLVVSELFNIDDGQLRGAVANLAQHEDDIRRALDRLFTGF